MSMTKEKLLHIISTKKWFVTDSVVYYLDQDPFLPYEQICAFEFYVYLYRGGAYEFSQVKFASVPWNKRIYSLPLGNREAVKLSFMSMGDIITHLSKIHKEKDFKAIYGGTNG